MLDASLVYIRVITGVRHPCMGRRARPQTATGTNLLTTLSTIEHLRELGLMYEGALGLHMAQLRPEVHFTWPFSLTRTEVPILCCPSTSSRGLSLDQGQCGPIHKDNTFSRAAHGLELHSAPCCLGHCHRRMHHLIHDGYTPEAQGLL